MPCEMIIQSSHICPLAAQHAVTFAAGLAAEGIAPMCAIYSSFLQRGYDQIVHDVVLQKLPVRFAMDRAGPGGRRRRHAQRLRRRHLHGRPAQHDHDGRESLSPFLPSTLPVPSCTCCAPVQHHHELQRRSPALTDTQCHSMLPSRALCCPV